MGRPLKCLSVTPDDQLHYIDHLIAEQRRVLTGANRMNYTIPAQKAERKIATLEAIRNRLTTAEGTTNVQAQYS